MIFRTIGQNKLATDLSIYGCGLFTLLGPSAMTVKPPLFDVFEEHLLPLRTALHPAFLGLLLVGYRFYFLSGFYGLFEWIKSFILFLVESLSDMDVYLR